MGYNIPFGNQAQEVPVTARHRVIWRRHQRRTQTPTLWIALYEKTKLRSEKDSLARAMLYT